MTTSNSFRYLLHQIEVRRAIREREARENAEAIFFEWRHVYLAALCKAIRIDYSLRSRGMKSSIDADWCNCAALILDCCDADTQDLFLRGSKKLKDKMTAAIFTDQGIYDANDRWVELPIL